MIGSSSGASGTWFWWCSGPGARRRALEEFRDLPRDIQAQISVRIERIKSGQQRASDVDSLGHGILEIRCRKGTNHYRVLFCSWGQHKVLLTAFYKNQQKTPQADLERAKDRRKAWLAAFGELPEDNPGA